MNAPLLHTSQGWAGLTGPVVPCLLEFNLLPSRTLHPGQIAQLAPPDGLISAHPGIQEALHRRWSKRLLDRLGTAAAPVLDLTEPALPLALAAPALLLHLARDLGIAMLGASLRRIIEREQVLAVRSALGEHGVAWALDGAARLHPGMADTHRWLQAGWAEAADQLGTGLLAQAWHDAPAPLRQRADWKLPPASQSTEHRTASGLAAPQARALCLQRLKQMEPAWHSSFPAIH